MYSGSALHIRLCAYIKLIFLTYKFFNVIQEPDGPNECLFDSDSSVSESDFGSERALSDSDGDSDESREDLSNKDQQFSAISKLLYHAFYSDFSNTSFYPCDPYLNFSL